MPNDLYRLTREFDRMTESLTASEKPRSLKDKLVKKLRLNAQDMSGGQAKVDPYTQAALKKLVDPNLAVDGVMGPETARALAKYKADRRIPSTESFPVVEKGLWNEYATGSRFEYTMDGGGVVPKPSVAKPAGVDMQTLNKERDVGGPSTAPFMPPTRRL